ncbi:MAG: peptide chain release factor N(5)-glutamine methyltransferase [Candidatus Daviesbacteria bacterium]|nr:peptide chain release factor N(5)-glutamine methyltransferase [Candidatus Daviesbacteria bacterium]
MTKQSIKQDRHANARDDNTPQQYQEGYVEFYKLRFKVTPDVLIPRPETELLVDYVLDFIKQQRTPNNELITILDIGTGSGNIAISIAKNLKDVRIIATDVSQKALKVARQNAKLHRVSDKIEFIQSNLLDVIASRAKQSNTDNDQRQIASSPLAPRNDNNIDIIVTNLPYIPSARIPHLDSSVKDFEPNVALDGGEDGFELYRKLFQQISDLATQPRRLPPRLIIGEIDYTHGESAALEAQKYFPDAEIEVKTDLAHKQRILLIRSKLS